MRKILFLTPSLAYGGAARRLTLLAAGLPREQFRVRVCVLGASAPWAESLGAAGVPVDVLGRTRAFDLAPFLALRRLVGEFRPDVVHAWGAAALWAAALTRGRGAGRLVASAVLPPARPPGRLDRWLLRGVDHVAALCGAEAERYGRLGVPGGCISVLPPAVDDARGAGVPPAPPCPAGGTPAPPPGARVVLGIGPLEPHKGFREAVWALDILNYLYANLHLVLAGGGSDRGRVGAFARAIGAAPRVHFTGPRADLAPLLGRAEVVWVPSLRGGGVGAALEAMAAGRPVVAARVPGLSEVVCDGETGYLVPPGDKAALARQTRVLLDDPGRRGRFGAAARRRAAGLYSRARLVRAAVPLYEGAGRNAAIPS